jgi:hypothetical protein
MHPFTVESLEPRQLLAVDPLALAVKTAIVNGGLELRVNGTNAADNIAITAIDGGLKVTNGSFTKSVAGNFKSIRIDAGKGNDTVSIEALISAKATIYRGKGDDTLTGGAGDDKLYGQAGTDLMNGASGDDVLVSIGDSKQDALFGGGGNDSFWADNSSSEAINDASADELAGGNVHRVANFYAFSTKTKRGARAVKTSIDLNGGAIADPLVGDASVKYKNFSNKPLFADDGPAADDIAQGYIGDCWYLATLAAMVQTDANTIRQAAVELGDGTYAVQFAKADGTKSFVRVDAELPVGWWGGMQYAQLGAQDSIWVAIMEKAYACYRDNGVASYATLDGGWMDEAFNDLGYRDTEMLWDATDGDTLLGEIEDQLNEGLAVTLAIYQAKSGAPVVGYHAYTVVSVQTDGDGNKTLTLRNPWGVDGAGNDGNNDGHVTLTATQALTSFWGVIAAAL